MQKQIIVDANIASRVLTNPGDAAYGDLHDALVKKKFPELKICLAYGGKLSTEYQKAGVMRIINLLDSAGRARQYPQVRISAEEEVVKKTLTCRSNDTHILAIARVSAARVLCSEDNKLRKDFKDRLILRPRGRIYSCKSHIDLLK